MGWITFRLEYSEQQINDKSCFRGNKSHLSLWHTPLVFFSFFQNEFLLQRSSQSDGPSWMFQCVYLLWQRRSWRGRQIWSRSPSVWRTCCSSWTENTNRAAVQKYTTQMLWNCQHTPQTQVLWFLNSKPTHNTDVLLLLNCKHRTQTSLTTATYVNCHQTHNTDVS